MTVLDTDRHFSNVSFVYVVEIDGASVVVVVVGCRSHRLRTHSRVVVVVAPPFSNAWVSRRVAGDY